MSVAQQQPLPDDSQGVQDNQGTVDQSELINSFLDDYGLKQDTKPSETADLVDESEKQEDFPAEEKHDTKPEEKPVQPQQTQTQDKMYTWKGQKYTAQQLVEQGILEDALTGAEQTPHYQRLYNDLKTQLDQVQQQVQGVQPQQTQQQQQAQVSPDQIVHAFAPEIARMTKEGYIEEDFAEAFPKLAAGLVWHRNMIYELRQAVGSMLNQHQQSQAQAYQTTLQSQINGLMDEVAQDETFQLLRDNQVRQGFWDYLVKIDPHVDKIDKKLIQDQFMAYNATAILEAAKANATASSAERKRQKQTAAGESSGTRPQTTQQSADTDSKLLNSFLDDMWPTGG